MKAAIGYSKYLSALKEYLLEYTIRYRVEWAESILAKYAYKKH